MHYRRATGTIFTVKNDEEKKIIIKKINSHTQLSQFFDCINLDLEQFTGKINRATFRTKDEFHKAMSYNVTGTYPIMVLSHPNSPSNTYTIEFDGKDEDEEGEPKHHIVSYLKDAQSGKFVPVDRSSHPNVPNIPQEEKKESNASEEPQNPSVEKSQSTTEKCDISEENSQTNSEVSVEPKVETEEKPEETPSAETPQPVQKHRRHHNDRRS